MSVSDSLRTSRAFAPIDRRFKTRDDELLRTKYVEVSLTSLQPSGWVPAVFALGASVPPFLLGFNLLMSSGRTLLTLPLALPAVALLALSLWLACAALLFRSRFYPCHVSVKALESFLYSNGLYDSHVQKMANGSKYERIDSSLRLRLFVRGPLLTVRAVDDGNGYTSRLSKLDDMGLCSVIGRPLDSRHEGIRCTDYVFRLVDDTRIQAVPRLLDSAPTGRLDCVPLTGQLSWYFTKLPHMLIAGGTGGGKSTFIYYLLAEFLRLGNGNGFAGEVYICDPKNAELASLSHVFGSDRVGVSPAQIAKVVRLCREEMDRRYEYMQDPSRFRFGANAFTYGLNPVFLIFDEVAAFKAGADKKTFAEVWDNLTQLVLKARAANVFVILAMQQPRAETISTDIRDNLGARVSLGTLSDEGYRMTFGGSFDFLPIEERGTGYIMLDGWDAPKPFKAPFADYSQVDYPKELKRLYIAAQSRNGVSADSQKDDGEESAADTQES